ncbi:ankyrin repeat domain-containing protein [Fluoribacter gormanii]|uniref:ankyrin repeat domain-containing protein n=1 Tax=Fluoribacter gormanii TaxID=464 RepID=UPI0022438601|nr:ankyrin repeat domain-containing protein [Fluoribacter gormanii]MCW8444550.1 ankyrin repeat domain-containing protein [Fluoribacter gormanii]
MRNLTQLPLFKNAASILEDLEQYRDTPEIQEGAKQLVQALNASEMSSPVFYHPSLPKYALSAFEKEEINETQFISMLLIWAALKDYSQKEQISLNVYKLTDKDEVAQQKLRGYLTIQHISNHFIGDGGNGIKDDMDDNSEEKLFKSILDQDIPESERCFYTFIVKDPGEYFGIFEAIKRTGFDLLMPKKIKSGEYEFIIPSMTIIQSVLNVLVQKPKKLYPQIGENDFDDVYEMHRLDAHPFGLSFPGTHEKSEADNLKSGCFGFALHDLYHVVLLSFTSEAHKDVFNAMIDLGKKLHSTVEEQKKRSYSEAVGSLIDNEFRQYVAGSTLSKAISKQQKTLLESNENAVIAAMMGVLVKSLFYEQILERSHSTTDADYSKATEDYIQTLEKINPKNTVAEKSEFCRELLAQLFQANGILNQQEIKLNRLVDILFNEERIVNTLGLDRVLSFDFTGFVSAYKHTVSLIQQQMVHCVRDPKNQKEGAWLNHYFDMAGKLQKAVHSNDIEEIKRIFLNKEYLQYYVSLDRIHGIEPSLIEQAAQLGHVETVRLLHSAGASLNALMLINAAKNKDIKMMNYLLEAGINPTEIDERGLSAIDYCLESGYIEGLKSVLAYTSLGRHHLEYLKYKGIQIHPDCNSLLERYDQFKKSLYDIYFCFENNKRAQLLYELVKSNTDGFSYLTQIEFDRLPDIHFSSNPKYYSSPNAHMYVNILDCLEIEQIHLMNQHTKLNVNQIDENGRSLLINLIDKAHKKDPELEIKMYRLLIELGANVNYVGPNGESPLGQALISNKFYLVEPLIKEGAEFHFEADDLNYLNSLLKYLANHPDGSKDFNNAFRQMLKNGLEFNQKRSIAIQKGFLDFNPEIKIVSLWSLMRDNHMHKVNIALNLRMFCIEQGADPNELSFDGNLELNVAIANGWDDYVVHLLKNNADPNKTDRSGLSPLHAAARKGNEKVMELLKQYGAKSTLNWRGKTPEEVLNETQSEQKVSALSMFKPVNNGSLEQQTNVPSLIN